MSLHSLIKRYMWVINIQLCINCTLTFRWYQMTNPITQFSSHMTAIKPPHTVHFTININPQRCECECCIVLTNISRKSRASGVTVSTCCWSCRGQLAIWAGEPDPCHSQFRAADSTCRQKSDAHSSSGWPCSVSIHD
jgi:hypothetical protein